MRNDARIAVLETTILNINSTLLELKQDMKRGFDKLESRLWTNFLWLMSMIIGVAGLIAHTQHWI